ncbi:MULTISPECIES: PLP-dependent aminotransferase family protein [Staphylococcus]|mgnify:FL=1|uniref:MocR-like pyridoxine biosynthesis transcription factor PdxR n=1 Tax=Staphylococcus TaxID=1279 RepID=UPI000E00779B|nr:MULTISPECIES: PLP-dependent aminotransferase family protein [Staphylococcus]MBN6093834.1 PLP-dependent aminotransferase family protein [Staphylococcus saprophyticus]MBN6096973.1 PLP-dependent aminotransferase family protein [Staphylococcus saprophyticus]MBN6098175.1 PLP-dependent aminotransferase family protein [Staphylococcus saprophyticus]MDW4092131.1 PLP-dependent aminotransferase family protein [Staphylococcus saprophyticus]MDW4361356.1 PLP-dependent aminotransferase family protein [Sta
MEKRHLYIELYENLKQQIIEGQYQSGDKFPSKRALGQHLSVSNTTIEHAYQFLLDEGYIYSKPRSGYFVSDIETLPIIKRNHSQLNGPSLDMISNNRHNDQSYQYAFNLSEIDAEYFPMLQFRKYARDVFEDDQLGLLQHTNPKGEWSLRQEIAHYLFNSRGVTCHPEQIIIGSSTEQLINLLTDMLSKEQFIIENPSYPPIKQVLDKKHIPYLQTPVNKTGIDLNYFSQTNNNIAYVTPSHQFPTGYVMNLKKRTQLINWAHQNEYRYIIEDDYDSEFRYFGKPIPALQSLDTKDKVIYISTFSKSLFPSCRIAYLVLPKKLLAQYEHLKNKEGNTVPAHLQKIVANFMESGSFERHLNKMRKVYSRKLKFILEKLKPYEDQLQIDGALAGMHFTLTVKNGYSMDQCLKNAANNQLKILPFYHYDKNQTSVKFILGFGGIPFSKLNDHTNALINSLCL